MARGEERQARIAASKISGGILTREEIKRLGIIESPITEERCYKPASYDFRLGEEYMLPGPANREKAGHAVVRYCSKDFPLEIPPFSSVLVSTYERVVLPLNVVGRFNLRVRMAFQGLVVQMGTQVEPGYNGRLFAVVQNISNRPVVINFADYGTRPFTAEFSFAIADTIVTGADKKSYDSVKDIMGASQFPAAIDTIVEKVDSHDKFFDKQSKFFSLWGAVIASLVFTGFLTAATLLISVLAPVIINASSKAVTDVTTGVVEALFDDRIDRLEHDGGAVAARAKSLGDEITAARAALNETQAELAEAQAAYLELLGRVTALEARNAMREDAGSERITK